MQISNSLNSLAGVFIALLFMQFLSVQSQFYTSAEQHFINCGSKSSFTLNTREFMADSNSDGMVASTSTANIIPLYQSARVFTSLSRYKLELENTGTYVVRLHFYPFSYPGRNLVDANFSVAASQFALLSNFRVHNSDKFPVIKEFIFSIDAGLFEIVFTPRKSSFAFVSSIETFLAPKDFIQIPVPHVNPSGQDKDDYNDLLSQVLRPVYRINVGGGLLNHDKDTLWRNWIPDDEFLYSKEVAENKSYDGKLNYLPGGADKDSAPELVYKTAKDLHLNSESPNNFFNITWQFNVTRNMKHFIRVHFCDIVNTSPNSNKFKFYIYSNFSTEVTDRENQLRAPFYDDFVVESDTSGLLNISIGPGVENQTAFLNGLEIMEVMNDRSLDGLGKKKTNRNVSLIIIIGSVVGGVAFVLVLLVIFVISRRRKAKAVENLDWPLVNINGGSFYSGLTESTANNESNFQIFNLELKLAFSDIMYATNKFDPKAIIGRGGFGKVYKGTLKSGVKVAVKRSESGHGQGFPEFQTEIMVLSSIRHRHLVSLIGYCDEMSEMILVYEFMEKGTLQDHLYKQSDPKSRVPSLSWNQRLQICIGAAKGLNYLHTEGSGGGIIHRDVKSTNILLDKDFVAKVSDFGLSRSGLPEQTHISTGVKGSFGYLDPEYFRCMQLTQKSDVYSFGVVLLEVLCARPVINKSLPPEQVSLADWGVYLQQEGKLENIVDPSLVGKINPNSLRKFGETVAKCLKEEGADRPSMVDVIWDLEYALQLQREPREESSTTDVSWAMPLPVVQRLPSTSLTINEDETHLGIDDILDSSYADASEVFSQLRIDDAR